jgi:putative oxidoreductase
MSDLVCIAHNLGRDVILQRLFSTFPDGWPGYGLLMLRIGIGIALICLGIDNFLTGDKEPIATARHFVAIIGGIFLISGFWTPITGTLMAIDELWIGFIASSSPRDGQWIHVFLAVLTAGTAMVGPGAWSIDAARFGRKRFDIASRSRTPHP